MSRIPGQRFERCSFCVWTERTRLSHSAKDSMFIIREQFCVLHTLLESSECECVVTKKYKHTLCWKGVDD